MKLFRPLCLILAILLFLLSFPACAKEDAAVNEWKPAEIEEDLKAAVAQLPGTELEFKLLFEDNGECEWALLRSRKEAKAFLCRWRKKSRLIDSYRQMQKVDFDSYYVLVCFHENTLPVKGSPFLIDLILQEESLVIVYQYYAGFSAVHETSAEKGTVSFVLIKKTAWPYGETLPDIYYTTYMEKDMNYDFVIGPILPEVANVYSREGKNHK